MTAMLGRFRHAGCGSGRCRHCGDGNETRAFKRIEARKLAAEALEALGTVPADGPPHPTPDECMHGCCGSPGCSGSCRFWCHG